MVSTLFLIAKIMEYYNKTLCVTYEELTSGDDPVIREATLRQNVKRGNIQCINRGGGEGNHALYSYSSLPAKYQQRCVIKYGEPEEIMKHEILRGRVRKDEKAEGFFEKHRYDKNGEPVTLPEETIAEYTRNASVLNTLISDITRLRPRRNALGVSGDFWEEILKRSEELRTEFNHTLPGSIGRLKELIKKYKPDHYEVLISGKYGNSNTLKIGEEEGRQLIALKRSQMPKYTDHQIFEEYNRIAPLKGWKPLKSERGMKGWLNSPRIKPLWHDAVFGEMRTHQLYDRKHHTLLPASRDSLWYGDGTKLNLYYRDENGNKCTTSVYEVVDAYSEVLLGYHISDNEDYIAQYHAFRMAIQRSGHKPYELVCDNQGGHKKNTARGFFSKISRIHRPTAPYNGESKTIENIFYRFQSQVLFKRFGFTGQNVTATKETSRPNLEFINANIDSLPTLDELHEIYASAREEWNEMKHPASGKPRIEMYESSENEDTDTVSVRDMVDMFWYTTEKPSTFTANGIKITVQKKEYTYEVFDDKGKPDLEWRRRNTYKQFYVQYAPFDMRSVRLLWMDKGGAMRFERVGLPPIYIHRAQQEQTEEEKAFIRAQQEAVANERVERQVTAKEIEYEYGVAPEQHGLVSPDLKGLTKEAQEQIDRRTRKYSHPKNRTIRISLGRDTKELSNVTWDQLKENNGVDLRKVAGKL